MCLYEVLMVEAWGGSGQLGEEARVHAQETTFNELVQGEKQYQVPLYQRTYSWQREQLKQLVNDQVIPRAQRHVIPQVLALSMST